MIEPQQLRDAKKILYMTHLALGDYMYQGACLKALAEQYPHLVIDVWFDDCRSRPKNWHQGRSQTLTDWLDAEDHIRRSYPLAKSDAQRQALISDAVSEEYDLVVFLATSRSTKYAQIALQIAGDNSSYGIYAKASDNWWNRLRYFAKLTKAQPEVDTYQHISEFYQLCFQQLFGETLQFSSAILPLNVDEQFQREAASTCQRIASDFGVEHPHWIFVNHLSTTDKRDWPKERLATLFSQLSKDNPETIFLCNCPPHAIEEFDLWLSEAAAQLDFNACSFTADKNFMQLPAMIKQADLVITVETAIMHFASSLGVPQITLMRAKAKQSKPLGDAQVLYASNRVSDIDVEQVVEACSCYQR